MDWQSNFETFLQAIRRINLLTENFLMIENYNYAVVKFI
jgi:hypothetical protein